MNDQIALLAAEQELRDAQQARVEANTRYRKALVDAKALGMSNSKIARTLRVSETAVREYVRRNRPV